MSSKPGIVRYPQLSVFKQNKVFSIVLYYFTYLQYIFNSIKKLKCLNQCDLPSFQRAWFYILWKRKFVSLPFIHLIVSTPSLASLNLNVFHLNGLMKTKVKVMIANCTWSHHGPLFRWESDVRMETSWSQRAQYLAEFREIGENPEMHIQFCFESKNLWPCQI